MLLSFTHGQSLAQVRRAGRLRGHLGRRTIKAQSAMGA